MVERASVALPPTAAPPSWAAQRQLDDRGGMGVHPQRRRLDAARRQAGRHPFPIDREARIAPGPGNVGCAIGRRQYRDRGRMADRGGVGIHPRRRRVVEGGPEAGRKRRGRSARQGASVALSADGSTAIVGGWSDNGRIGAAWVFTRSSRGAWSQQGKKLVGTNAVGRAGQGTSVALSADGNTAVVGGPGDNPWDRSVPFGLGAAGAAWVFTRTNGVWTQQGSKLVGVKGAPVRACRWRCPPTATSPPWAGLPRARAWARYRSSPAGRPLDPRPEAGRQQRCGNRTRGRAAGRIALRDGRGFERQRRGRCGVVFTRESGSWAQDSKPAEQQSKPTEPSATPPVFGSAAVIGGADGGAGDTSGFSGSRPGAAGAIRPWDPAVFLEEDACLRRLHTPHDCPRHCDPYDARR